LNFLAFNFVFIGHGLRKGLRKKCKLLYFKIVELMPVFMDVINCAGTANRIFHKLHFQGISFNRGLRCELKNWEILVLLRSRIDSSYHL